MTTPPPPARPPALPYSGVAENGAERCNEPYVVEGYTVGHCRRWVKPVRSRWRRPKRSHRGPHRIEWWS